MRKADKLADCDSSVTVSSDVRRRFLDKTGYTGSTFQFINGAFLLSTFFLVRIVYGWYIVSHILEYLLAFQFTHPWLALVYRVLESPLHVYPSNTGSILGSIPDGTLRADDA